ncbi:hypothetical protein EVAR_85421_1 [Eumeta japonica]|uniref:Uncharacterized protein n=1 Tax=Eumeta variegata TaxID=151549 RepID=A0A4C1WK35_EUMVA|nr:hypothetical protein EVAR_85421_1 [Eumeta japonica]
MSIGEPCIVLVKRAREQLSGYAIYKLQRNRRIRRSCTPNATHEARAVINKSDHQNAVHHFAHTPQESVPRGDCEGKSETHAAVCQILYFLASRRASAGRALIPSAKHFNSLVLPTRALNAFARGDVFTPELGPASYAGLRNWDYLYFFAICAGSHFSAIACAPLRVCFYRDGMIDRSIS